MLVGPVALDLESNRDHQYKFLQFDPRLDIRMPKSTYHKEKYRSDPTFTRHGNTSTSTSLFETLRAEADTRFFMRTDTSNCPQRDLLAGGLTDGLEMAQGMSQ
jgi:hypothetical protein